MGFKTKAENYAYYKGYLKGLTEGKKQVNKPKSFKRIVEPSEWMKREEKGIIDEIKPLKTNFDINDFFKVK